MSEMSKTILPGGGSADHIPEFIQEAPSNAFVRNGQFEKRDQVKKKQPYKAIQTNDLPDPLVGSPMVLEQAGEELMALDPNGTVYTTREGDNFWRVTETNMLPTKNEQLLNTFAASSRQHTFCYNTSGTIPVTCVAWSEYTPSAEDEPASSQVQYRVYQGERLVQTGLIRNATCPHILNTNSPALSGVLYVQRTVGSLAGDIEAALMSVLGVTTPTTIIANTGNADLPWLADANADFPATPLNRPNDDCTERQAWMSGLQQDGGNCGTLAATMATDFSGGAIGYTTSTTGSASYRRVDVNGNGVGGSVSVATGGGSTTNIILDLDVYTDGSVAVLYTEYDTSTRRSTVFVRTFDASDTPDAPVTVTGAVTGLVVKGVITQSNTKSGLLATTIVRGEPWDLRRIIPSFASTQVQIFSSVSATPAGFSTVDQVLASKSIINDATDRDPGIEFVLQSFYPHTEPVGATNTDADTFVIPSNIINRPRTSVLVRYNLGGEVTFISSYDAAQSLQTPGSGNQQNYHLTPLQYDATTQKWHYLNRVVLEVEDTVLLNTFSDADTDFKRKSVLSAGEAELRLHSSEHGSLFKVLTLPSERFGDLVTIAAGIPMIWDGAQLVEASPFDQPEILTILGVDDTAPGSPEFFPSRLQNEITSGSNVEWRGIDVIQQFVDNTGAVHRSAPCARQYIRGFNAPEFGTIRVYATRPLSATTQPSTFYTSETYLGVGTASPQLASTISVDIANYTDLLTTSAVSDNRDKLRGAGVPDGFRRVVRNTEATYTEGGVLPADPFPSYRDIAVGANRIMVISDTNSGIIFYSKLFEANIYPEFSASLVIELGQDKTLTAIAPLDEKFIVFERDAITVISNSGPDNTGSNGDFFVDELQNTVGCEDPESVVQTPDGVMFYSPQTETFQMVTRDLQVLEIGQPVEDVTKNMDILAAILLPGRREVRYFVSSDSTEEFGPTPNTDPGTPPRPARPRYKNVRGQVPCLVYSYEYKAWSVHRLIDSLAVDATVWNDNPVYINIGWEPLVETTWDDTELLVNRTGTDQGLLIRTPWIRTQNLQSFSRFTEIACVGKYLSSWTKNSDGELAAGDVQVTLRYDYQGYDPSETTFRFRANDGDLGTEIADRMQFSVFPGQPKCQAIQIEIEEIQTEKLDDAEPDYVLGEGFVIEGIDLRYTTKTGLGDKTLNQRRSK